MYLFVGLGNIGKEYEYTRHNFGFMCVDHIVEKYGFRDKKEKFNATIFNSVIETHNVIIVKPSTYMNRSGIAVSQIKSFYKIPLENIFVFHDDLDLQLGRVKFKTGGSSGGHNGIKSIDEFVGNNYNRVRLGIGRPDNKDKVIGFVLDKFTNEEERKVKEVTNCVVDSIGCLFNDKKDSFVNSCNSLINLHKENLE